MKFKQTEAVKPSDFLGEFATLAGKQGTSGGSNGANSGVGVIGAAEAYGILSRAQVAVDKMGMELAAIAEDRLRLKKKVEKKEQKLAAALNSFKTENTEKLAIIADKVQLAAEVDALKAKKAADDKDADDARAKLAALEAQIATLTADLATANTALEAEKSAFAAFKLAAGTKGGADNSGASGIAGDAAANTESLSAEEAAERIAAEQESDPIVKELFRLEAKLEDPTYTPADLRAYQSFITKNKAELNKRGVPA